MSRVLAVGSLLPQAATGLVFSVHDHVVNIVLSDRPRLVSIVDRERDLTGLSVLVSSLPNPPARGDAAELTPGRLVISGQLTAPATLAWEADVRRFDGRLDGIVLNADSPDVARLIGHCRSALARHGAPDGLLDIGVGRVPRNAHARKAAELLAASSTNAPAAQIALLARLIGLGPGFTPSGDDFICGALAARAAASGSDVSTRRMQPILDRLFSTTVGGATLVYLACEGSFPAYLVEFVTDLAHAADHGATDRRGGGNWRAQDASPEGAVQRAVAHGATSGTDAVAGFLWMMERVPGASLDELSR